ncbi:hypothetical protein [Streptomyces thermodiastaticus]|uniref:hypothetical protein n=1 Tax=Streptomyces thermodiastaticus TaxID=44061 RepID=UPI0016750C5A|nr:hypothetical protein [Streptomyces thermodiastaticus]MCE7552763.1 hypothetical protein [Streptomyces thermodiastaticus]GHF89092.1 hypothetical protein GCM10018787_42220 [Streptomyces thermodiastaticus]
MELTWGKEAAGSYFATNKSGQVVATARKEGNVWHVEVAHDNRVRQVGTYRQAREVAARVLEDQRWESVRAEYLSEGDTLRFYEGEGTVTAVEEVGNNLGQLRVTYLFDGKRNTVTVYPGSTFERLRKVEPEAAEEERAAAFVDRHFPTVAAFLDAEESNPCGTRRSGWERPGPGRHRLPCILPAGHGGLHRDILRTEWLESEAGQVIDLHPFTAIVDVIAGTGVLISPPAIEDVTLSDGGATLHDALLADALRRLVPLGVEALEGEDGGLSVEGVTPDGRKVFSLYVSDCITTEPDFEEVAVSVEALRQAAGL